MVKIWISRKDFAISQQKSEVENLNLKKKHCLGNFKFDVAFFRGEIEFLEGGGVHWLRILAERI